MLYFYITCISKESLSRYGGIDLCHSHTGFYKVFGREGTHKLHSLIRDNILGVTLVHGIHDEFPEQPRSVAHNAVESVVHIDTVVAHATGTGTGGSSVLLGVRVQA